MGASILRIAAAPEAYSGEPVLSGDLEDMCLPTLLHLLEIESHTGWLKVDDDRRIDLCRGHVTGASAGDLEGIEALKEVLVAGGSRFEVFHGKPQNEQALERVSSTLFDSYRILDEWAKIEGTVLRLVGDQRWWPTGRPIDALMEVLDGKTPLRDLAAKTGVSLCSVVDEVLEAKRLGLVVATEVVTVEGAIEPGEAGHDLPKRGGTPATDDVFVGVDFFDLLDRARASIKRADYGLAEAALQAALRLRPDDRVASQNLRRVRELRGP